MYTEGYSTISEILMDAMKERQQPLMLLIDFLVKEKQVIKLNDPAAILEPYLDPGYKHRDYVNTALVDYVEKRKDDKTWICYGYYK